MLAPCLAPDGRWKAVPHGSDMVPHTCPHLQCFSLIWRALCPCDDMLYPQSTLSTPPDSVAVKGTALTDRGTAPTIGAGSCIQPKLLFVFAGTGTESSGLKLQKGKFWLFLKKNCTTLELVKQSS